MKHHRDDCATGPRWAVVIVMMAGGFVFGGNPDFITSAVFAEEASAESADSSLKPAPAATLVLVNGHSITEENLEFHRLSRQLDENPNEETRKILIDQLIDRQLVREFLRERKVEANELLLEDQVGRIHRLIRQQGKEPEEVLSKLGYDNKRLRDELSLGITWQVHVRRTLTEDQIREEFSNHRELFDGTELRASQIFLKLAPDTAEAEVEQAKQKLVHLREEILAGRISFDEAARKNSQAPSREVGGDLGFFPYRGRMPVEFTQVAFGLKQGEVSEPFRTRFGMHLCTITDRKPGQLSLEDARPEILRRLGNDLWQQVVQEERKRARIEWK